MESQDLPQFAEALRRQALLVAIAAAWFVVLFFPVLTGLVAAWLHDPDLSYGLVVAPISAWILWQDRKALGRVRVRRSVGGGLLLGLSVLLFFVGYATSTNLFQRLALWGALVGSVLFVFGPGIIRAGSFPVAFLLFAIPPPFVLLSPARIQLKLVATNLATDVLRWLGTPAFAEGNVVLIGECRLEVADACSGIRSLMAMVATAALLSYLCRVGVARGALLTLASLPVTVIVNSLRVVVMAIALSRWNVDLGRGTPHDVLGVAVFAAGVGLLYALSRVLGTPRKAPLPSRGAP